MALYRGWGRGMVSSLYAVVGTEAWSLYGEVQCIMDKDHMGSPYEKNDR